MGLFQWFTEERVKVFGKREVSYLEPHAKSLSAIHCLKDGSVDYEVISNMLMKVQKIRMQNDHWYKRYNSPGATRSLPLTALIAHELIGGDINIIFSDIQKKTNLGYHYNYESDAA